MSEESADSGVTDVVAVAAALAVESEERWQAHLAAADSSSYSYTEYCRRHRLDPVAFRAYRKKQRRAKQRDVGQRPPAQPPSAFVQITKPDSEAPRVRPSQQAGREAARLPDPRWTAEFIAALASLSR